MARILQDETTSQAEDLPKTEGVKFSNFLQAPIGAAKGIASTVSKGSALMQKTFNALTPGSRQVTELPASMTEAKGGWQQAGKMAEQIGEFMLPSGLVSKGTKALQGIKGVSTLAGKTKNLVDFGTKVLPEVLSSTVVGSAQSGSLKEGAKAGAWTGGFMAAAAPVSKALKGLSNIAYSRAIPTTLKESTKDFAKNMNIGEAISNTGISLSKKQLLNKISNLSKPLTNKVNNAVDRAVQTKGTKFKITDITKNLKDSIFKDKTTLSTLKATPGDLPKVTSAIDDVIDTYNNLPQYKDKILSLKDLQKLKIDLGQGLKAEFQKAVGATQAAKPFTEMAIRKSVKETIEKEAPAVVNLNKKLAPLLEASGRIQRKGGKYSGVITDLIAGGIVSNPTDVFTNPKKFARDFLTGIALKRGAGSTLAKTGTGKVLAETSKLLKDKAFLTSIREIARNSINGQ